MTTNELVNIWGALACGAIWANSPQPSRIKRIAAIFFTVLAAVQLFAAVIRITQ